jgi:hypothetical protein
MRDPAQLASLLAAGILPNLAYLALGLWLLRILGEAARGAERLALAFVFGTGVASLLLLGLRAADVPVPTWGLAAVAAAGLPRWRDARAGASRPERPGWCGAVDAASFGVAGLAFLAALAPETWWDGFEYHLPIAQAWSAGPVRALPGMLDAELRAGVDLLYVPAVAAGASDAAAAVSACTAAALAALIRAEATRRASAGAGSLAGLFALLVPFTLERAASTTVDLAVGAYGFCGLLYADRWSRGAGTMTLTAGALCLAFAANAKLHALILAPAAGVLLLAGGRQPRALQLAGYAGIVAAGVAPWFVKVALTTGNPLFPFFCEWLGYGPTAEDLLSAKRGDVYSYVHVERSAAGLASYLTSLTFGRTYHVSGLLGPLPLALAPLALARMARPTAVLVGVALALCGLQFWFMPALRFGAPLLPWLAVATAVGGARLARSGAAAGGVLGVALVGLALLHGGSTLACFGPRVAALRAPEAYARSKFPDQVALRELVARAEPVVAIPRGAVAWMSQPVYNLHWSRNGELFFDGRTPAHAARALLERRGVRSIAFDVERTRLEAGEVGHPLLDTWLRDGSARLRPDPDPPPARRGRVWVLVELR